jgi:hypothetical protein
VEINTWGGLRGLGDWAEFIAYSSKLISWLLASNSPRETALVTAVAYMPNTFETANVVMPSFRTAQQVWSMGTGVWGRPCVYAFALLTSSRLSAEAIASPRNHGDAGKKIREPWGRW